MEKAQRCHTKSRKSRIPCKAASVHTEENSSEIDIPTDLVFGNPPQIFTDPTYTAAVTHTDSEGEEKHNTNFLGKYCDIATDVEKHVCWCFTSDEDRLDANNPNSSVEGYPIPNSQEAPCRLVWKQMQSH